MNQHKKRSLDLVDTDAQQSPSRSRLTRACAECKKHKIKCVVPQGSSACHKCLKSGIDCEPYNFAQKFMDDDTKWKEQTASDLEQLKREVQKLLQQSQSAPLVEKTPVGDHSSGGDASEQRNSPFAVSALENNVSAPNYVSEGTATATLDEEETVLVSEPMSSLYSLTEPSSSRLIRVDPSHANGPDLISKGIISAADAEDLFARYRDRINPTLWDGLLCPHRTLQQVRQSSTLLTATVLTVAALQSPGREEALDASYNAFVHLMRDSCLLRSQSLDDIRGLCVGAFFLTSLSWALVSRAVRIATEMGLHKSSLQFSRGAFESYEKVQIWYMLYVCDHHFALAYGRPPLMHDDAAVRNADKFLQSGLTTSGDVKLIAQVALFRILAEAYVLYGCDPDLELNEQDYEKLREFTVAVDQWRLKYHRQLREPLDGHQGSARLLVLYHHFARFHLNSMALRHIAVRDVARESWFNELTFDRREAAHIAIAAAISTLKLLIEDTNLNRALIAMPIFTHAMISVCASFLLKIAVAFGCMTPDRKTVLVPQDLVRLGLSFHTADALTLVQALTRTIRTSTKDASSRHVANHIATGLEELSHRFTGPSSDGLYRYSRHALVHHADEASLLHPGADHDTRHALFVSREERNTGHTPPVDVLPHNSLLDWHGHMQDPYDLMGDLDWRFNDSFLWRVDGQNPFY